MKKFYRFFSLMLLAFVGINTASAIEVSTSQFTIGPGQIVTVKVFVKNALDDMSTVNVSFDLPEGVNVVGVDPESDEEQPFEIIQNDAAFSGSMANSYAKEAIGVGAYNILFYSTKFSGNALTDEGDWFFSFDVECNATTAVEGAITFADYDGTFGLYFNSESEGLFAQGENLSVPEQPVSVKTEFTATMAESGYTSICSTTDLDFSGVEDLTAYVVTKTEDGKATLAEIDNAPANTGVILKGIAGTTYEIPTGEATAPDANLLKGVTAATTIKGDGSQFFLVGGEFVKAANPATLPAGKAYLTASASAKAFDVLEFDFDGDATAIQNVEKEQFDGAIYNLNGVRVDNPTKGVYVKDGKKFVVK